MTKPKPLTLEQTKQLKSDYLRFSQIAKEQKVLTDSIKKLREEIVSMQSALVAKKLQVASLQGHYSAIDRERFYLSKKSYSFPASKEEIINILNEIKKEANNV